MSKFCGVAGISLLAWGCLFVPSGAQETVDKASLAGLVRDGSGAVIAGASVTVEQAQTALRQRVMTNRAGRFRFSYLPVGRYAVSVGGAGFQTQVERVDLSVGAAFDLDVELRVGDAGTTVEVRAAAPVVETGRSQVAATVSGQEIDHLPFLSRNFLDLALLLPGVSQTNTASTQLFAETSAVPGQGLSINSQRNFSNGFVVDGLSANDDAAGLVITSYALDSIAEAAVVTSGGQAEFGRALGGYLSFVTCSGTNALHGTAYGYLRNQRLNADNALLGRKLPLTQGQYGASVGGPVVRDRTFLFGNFEQRHLQQNGIITISAANAGAIDGRLAATSYAGQALAVDASGNTLYSNPVKSNNFLTRLDHRVSGRDDLTARYSLYEVASLNSRGVAGLSATSAGAGLNDLDQTVAVSHVATLSGRTVNETRAQFTNSDLTAPVNDASGPAVNISGVAVFGTLSGSPTGRHDRLYEVVDNVSHPVGRHALRAGVDFLYNDLLITFPMSSKGSYAFSSLANFQRGQYTTFTQSFGNPQVAQTNPNVGLYLQDSWQAASRLVLNVGVRYDLDFLQTVSTDTNNVSPRLGFAWTPYAGGRTVVRGSYGLFYDRVPLRALSNALESDGNGTGLSASTFTTLALSLGQAGAPVFPAIDAGYTALNLPGNLRLSLTTLDPHLANAASQQASLEVDQQLTASSHVAVSYQHVRGEHLLASVNLNTPACAAALDPVNLCRPVSGYANNRQYRGAGDSYYDGLAVSLEQRPVSWGSYRVSYTWSKAIDDVGEFFFSAPVNNYDIAEDRSRSDDDQRHRFAVSGMARTGAGGRLGGLEGSAVLLYDSRLPFNIVTGAQSIQQTALRPCVAGVTNCALALPGTLIGRNAGVGFDTFSLNVRLGKTFVLGERYKVEALAEAFNALNHRNDAVPNGTLNATSNSTFGQATQVGDPRQVQLGLKVAF